MTSNSQNFSNNKTSLSSLVHNVSTQIKGDSTSLSTMFSLIGERSHSFIILFFSIPFLQPVPLPGLSIVLGFVMALSGLGIITGKKIFIPQWIARRKIDSSILKKIFNAIFHVLGKTEHLVRPRFPMIVDYKSVRLFCGLLIIISALFLSLPLPPGTNFPPALVCFFLALGLLEKDLYLIIIGTVLFSLEVSLIGYVIKLFHSWLS